MCTPGHTDLMNQFHISGIFYSFMLSTISSLSIICLAIFSSFDRTTITSARPVHNDLRYLWAPCYPPSPCSTRPCKISVHTCSFPSRCHGWHLRRRMHGAQVLSFLREPLLELLCTNAFQWPVIKTVSKEPEAVTTAAPHSNVRTADSDICFVFWLITNYYYKWFSAHQKCDQKLDCSNYYPAVSVLSSPSLWPCILVKELLVTRLSSFKVVSS